MKNAASLRTWLLSVRAASGMSFRVSDLDGVEFKESRSGRYAKPSCPPSTGIMASRKQNGFSMLEMVIAISVSLILAGAVTVTMQTTFKQQQVNDAYNTTLTTLRRARDQAAADMRVYCVTFGPPGILVVNGNPITNGGYIMVNETNPAGTLLFYATLPPQVTYHLEPGIPNTAATTPGRFWHGNQRIRF